MKKYKNLIIKIFIILFAFLSVVFVLLQCQPIIKNRKYNLKFPKEDVWQQGSSYVNIRYDEEYVVFFDYNRYTFYSKYTRQVFPKHTVERFSDEYYALKNNVLTFYDSGESISSFETDKPKEENFKNSFLTITLNDSIFYKPMHYFWLSLICALCCGALIFYKFKDRIIGLFLFCSSHSATACANTYLVKEL